MGLAAYDEFMSFAHHPSGLGDWFFRAAAFPDLPDNSDEYFQRYYPDHAPHNRGIRQLVLEKRAGVVAHFTAMIDRYGLDRADVVGLTSMFSQNVACLAMAARRWRTSPTTSRTTTTRRRTRSTRRGW